MTNLLQDGAAWLAERLIESAGRTASYRRGGNVASGLNLIPTESRHQATDRNGQVITQRMADWLIKGSDLVLNGKTILPLTGDVVETTIGAKSEQYEVVPAPDGRAFEFEDSHQHMLRVHTVRRQRN